MRRKLKMIGIQLVMLVASTLWVMSVAYSNLTIMVVISGITLLTVHFVAVAIGIYDWLERLNEFEDWKTQVKQ